jgi:glycosyltransferase involved in cell wall biosynthesis
MPQAAISVVMPAYHAASTIAGAVASLIAQDFPAWRLVVIADDGEDYERLLAAAGIRDPRCRFLDSGGVATGASHARNIGLAAIDTPYATLLDADDRIAPAKLGRLVTALGEHAIVSTALQVTDADLRPLRQVAAGPDRLLTAAEHKWVNFSMDAMIGWDLRRTEARFDPALPNMTDLDFLMRLYARAPSSFHIGVPLHLYVKLATSMSNGAGVTARMIAAKTLLRQRLAAGYYRFADPGAAEGLDAFLDVSIAAERSYPEALARRPGLLFEDHIEPLLKEAAA